MTGPLEGETADRPTWCTAFTAGGQRKRQSVRPFDHGVDLIVAGQPSGHEQPARVVGRQRLELHDVGQMLPPISPPAPVGRPPTRDDNTGTSRRVQAAHRLDRVPPAVRRNAARRLGPDGSRWCRRRSRSSPQHPPSVFHGRVRGRAQVAANTGRDGRGLMTPTRPGAMPLGVFVVR